MVKEEHCVPWTIHFGKEEPGPIFCLPPKRVWQQPEKSKDCSAELPHLSVNFKVLCKDLGRAVRAGRKRPLKRDPRHILGIKSFSQRAGRGRGLCVTLGL